MAGFSHRHQRQRDILRGTTNSSHVPIRDGKGLVDSFHICFIPEDIYISTEGSHGFTLILKKNKNTDNNRA
jgi:hypothetical protein